MSMQWNYILKTLKFTIIFQFILSYHQYTRYCVISSFLILILLFVFYFLISFKFYLFYFPEAVVEPLGSARGALSAPRSTGWEPLL